MASVMAAIKAKIIEQLVSETALTAAYNGFPSLPTIHPPYAIAVVSGAGDVDPSLNMTYDEPHEVEIEIWANSEDQAEEISEAVMQIWKDTTNMTALTTLNAVLMNFAGRYGPIETDRDQKYMAVVLFDLLVRYTVS